MGQELRGNPFDPEPRPDPCCCRKEARVPVRALADISGPFYTIDKPFRNWSSLPYYQLDLPHAPYVDQVQLEGGIVRATAYLHAIHAQGYSGIVIDNLAHLVGFANAPVSIYASGSRFRLRAAIYQAAFDQLFATAQTLGMEVFVTTDMQWSTPPVRDYVGRLSATNPRLAAINRWALEELLARFPQVSGLVIRVGEAGGAHDLGGDYCGHMLYTTAAQLRELIDTLLPVCVRLNRLLVVRTWSVGVGELGDLIWNPTRYHAVFAGLDSPQLRVSIKHGPGDFFRNAPHNSTLGLPGPRQIIELQNRREYELFGMVPSSVAALHQRVLHHAAENPRFDGVWAWNATGGWGGGRAALGTSGWSTWTELNSAVTAALAHDPDHNMATFIAAWCEARFGGVFGAAVAATYHESAALIERGWYPGGQPSHGRTLGKLHLPPLLWVWWTRPTASLLIWAYLAATVPPTQANERAAAITAAQRHADTLAALAPGDNTEAAQIVASMRYLADALRVADAVQGCLVPLCAAAARAQRGTWMAQSGMAEAARTVLHAHHDTWAGNRDFPPLELDEIDHLLQRIAAAPERIWPLARAATLIVTEAQRAAALPAGSHRAGALVVGVVATSALTLALLRHRPGTLGVAGLIATLITLPQLRQRAVKALLPWLSRETYLLPSIFFETGPSFTEWSRR